MNYWDANLRVGMINKQSSPKLTYACIIQSTIP